ncbi:MAG: DUF1801 domain-containing protein [Candidatus Thermoplasmatota archaeon]
MAKPKVPDPAGVEAFIARWPPATQRQLQTLRKAILAALPEPTEHISYGVPAVQSRGKFALYYGAAKEHTTLHAMGSKVFDEHPEWTKGYGMGKGSIQFPHDKPIPVALIKRIAKARAADLAAGVPSYQARRAAAKKTPASKPAKAKPTAPTASPKPKPVKMAKADGDAAVQAYLARLPSGQHAHAKRIDALVSKTVPGVKKAVKWSAALYGLEETGWFLSFKGFQSYLKLSFFSGAMLKPVPPSGSGKGMRALDLRDGDKLDERLVASWVKQAATIPGWGTV